MSAPLILTLGLDAEATARFDALRTAHFPPDRLVVGAHLTLFHALPGEREAEVAGVVRAAAAQAGPLHLVCDRVLRLGRGVALHVDGPGLAELRAAVAAPFRDVDAVPGPEAPHELGRRRRLEVHVELGLRDGWHGARPYPASAASRTCSQGPPA